MLNTQIGATRSWNGQYKVNCSTIPLLPDLSFYFDGKPYTLKSTDYIVKLQDTCISSFTGLDINPPDGALWIIGDTFLHRFYTVYDLGRNAVGFAPVA
ncbi:hypothetical protein ID866_9864 [Astraeus odoratus]|nr:hypothetical protein ID866_9864 [Astraeus odoratus]